MTSTNKFSLNPDAKTPVPFVSTNFSTEFKKEIIKGYQIIKTKSKLKKQSSYDEFFAESTNHPYMTREAPIHGPSDDPSNIVNG